MSADGRIQRTRGWILQAFNAMVLNRRYQDIDVSEIAGRAGVGRSTFYEHFQGKGEVLRRAVSRVLEPLAEATTDAGDERRLLGVLEHVSAHRSACLQLLDGEGRLEVERALADLIEPRLHGRTSPSESLPAALLARQIAKMQLGVLQAWLEPRIRPCPSSTLATSLLRTTRAAVAAA